jgi:hypothetical protein
MIISLSNTFRIFSSRQQWVVQKLSATSWEGKAYYTGLPALQRALQKTGPDGIRPAGFKLPAVLASIAEAFAWMEATAKESPAIKYSPAFSVTVGECWRVIADQRQFITTDGKQQRGYYRTLCDALIGLASQRVRIIEGVADEATLDELEIIHRDIQSAVLQASA